MSKNSDVVAPIRVRVLGDVELRIGDQGVAISSEALFAFGLYLTTLAGQRIPRQEVMDTFWMTGDEESRRHAMRQMLYRIRQKGFAFKEEGEFLQVDADIVDSDVLQCLSPRWPETARPDQVESALALGPTFSSKLPSPFLDWFDEIRSAVTNQARKGAFHLLDAARARGSWTDVEHWAKAVLKSDSLNEEATLALAEAMAMSGLKGQALEVLDTYLLEVGADASAPSRPAALLRKRIAERRTGWSKSGARPVHLVGRSEEMARIITAIDGSARGDGRAVLLVGPPGIGKSRLLEEATEYGCLRGHRIVALRGAPTFAAHPWSFVRELIKAILALPGAAAIHPRAMDTARAVTRDSTLPPSSLTFSPAIASSDIEESLSALLHAVSQEVKTLLLLDDLQHSDEPSLLALSRVMLSVGNTRCSIIAATHPSTASIIGLKSVSMGPLMLRLPPLSLDDSQELAVATLSAQDRPLDRANISALANASGGNPLFIRELALAHSRSGDSADLPSTLSEIVNRSLAAQDPMAIRVLRATALLADTATIARVQAIAGVDPTVFLGIVEGIAHEGIIYLDASRTIRLHDSWREAVLDAMSDAACAAFALECAAHLENDTGTYSSTTQRRIGELLLLAGESERALEYILASLDTLLGAGLYEAVVSKAHWAETADLRNQSSARMRLRRAVGLLAQGRPDLALPMSEEIWKSRVLQSPGLHSEHLLAVGIAADSHLKLDSADRGPHSELLALAHHESLSVADRIRACLWGVRLVSNTARLEALDRFVVALRDMPSDYRQSPVATLVELIYAAERGSASDILAAYELMRGLDQSEMSVYDRCLLIRCSAHALRIAGCFHEAAAESESAYRLSVAHGVTYGARLAAELTCNIYLDVEHHEHASKWLAEGLSHVKAGGPDELQTSVMQTQDRLAIQSGQEDLLAARATDRLALARSYGETHGRASALAMASIALRAASRLEDSQRVLREALDAVRPFIGRYSGDFTIELCLRAAEGTAALSEAASVARLHLPIRLAGGRPKLAPACRRLIAFTD